MGGWDWWDFRGWEGPCFPMPPALWRLPYLLALRLLSAAVDVLAYRWVLRYLANARWVEFPD